MKELILSNKMVAIVDDKNFERLSKWSWQVLGEGKGSIARNGWVNGKSQHISLASEIMCDYTKMYDHIDTNPLNNLESNLRECTTSLNSRNRAKRESCSSIFVGVRYHTRDKRWLAAIGKGRKQVHIGCYGTELEAAKAFNDKARELGVHEFTNMNKDSKGNIL